MDSKGKERGILKLEPRPRPPDKKTDLTPQGSCDRPLSSPQPSVDRLSVTWADPSSMTSSGVNLFHLPSDTPISNEVNISPNGEDGTDDEDYSKSLTAVIRQRRASVRRSRKGRVRRSSSPFLPDESTSRRRSSVFTTSSGDTAISIEEQPILSQEQIFKNIGLHKEVLGSVKLMPLEMRRKLKLVHQAKTYIKQHEGKLQERLAQSKNTRDIYARFTILIATKWQQIKREAANTSNLLIPWELRIKEIESHFGSVVASYFTFLRWLFWVNLVIAFILLVFVIIPEYLTAHPEQDGERKVILDDEKQNATNLLTLWEFEGVLKYSLIFYGYYSNIERPQYRMPVAYFLTGLVVYIYSFVAILRKMAENSRMSKLSEKEDECIFSWKLFTGWDFMIGNAETAHNRIASVILGFKEALLEEAEKKRKSRDWRILSQRIVVNLCVLILLAVSAYAVVYVVSQSDDKLKPRSWWRENETTIVVTGISITFPFIFEFLGLLEHYHPRKQLRFQLARIMLLNLLNLYSLIFALFSKIDGMSKELVSLQPTLSFNATLISEAALDINESILKKFQINSEYCIEELIPCIPCDMEAYCSVNMPPYNDLDNLEANVFTSPLTTEFTDVFSTYKSDDIMKNYNKQKHQKTPFDYLHAENLMQYKSNRIIDEDESFLNEIERIRKLSAVNNSTEISSENDDYDANDTFYSTYGDFGSASSTNTAESSTYETISTNDVTYSTNYFSEYDLETDTQLTTQSVETTSDYSYYSDESSTHSTRSDETVSVYNDFSESSTPSTFSEYDTETSTEEQKHIKSTNPTSGSKYRITNSYYYTNPTNLYFSDISSTESTTDDFSASTAKNERFCPEAHFNCSLNCDNKNITQVILISGCVVTKVRCYLKKCIGNTLSKSNITNVTMINTVHIDNNRKVYNLTIETKKKLLKLCWETMFGQELVKLTMMDLVFVVLGALFMDFFRALFVRHLNRCWCWDLEKKCPQYGDFKIAENILHLINNQGMVWMGMFFSPGLVLLNVVKLMMMMYLRSWAVMTCNVPHEVVFRVSKSNNFYLALLLTMLFLCVLPVGYAIVWVKPSWHCGPFSEYDKIYKILTSNIYKVLPKTLNFSLEYTTSPAIVIPLLVLLILIIYYLTSLTNSLREANNDLKIQLRRERTEERRKMFQLADTRRRGGSSSIDNTPFARWKKALPALPIGKSIDSDDKKPGTDEDMKDSKKCVKKRGIFEKIVNMAWDKRDKIGNLDKSTNIDDDTDTDFHEALPKEILKSKEIGLIKDEYNHKERPECNLNDNTDIKQTKNEKSSVVSTVDNPKEVGEDNIAWTGKCTPKIRNITNKKQSSESSNQSKQSDSIGSVIPVITISTTESDDEILQTLKEADKLTPSSKQKSKRDCFERQISKMVDEAQETTTLKRVQKSCDLKSLRRQNSVESVNENRVIKDSKSNEGGHKYQYSL